MVFVKSKEVIIYLFLFIYSHFLALNDPIPTIVSVLFPVEKNNPHSSLTIGLKFVQTNWCLPPNTEDQSVWMAGCRLGAGCWVLGALDLAKTKPSQTPAQLDSAQKISLPETLGLLPFGACVCRCCGCCCCSALRLRSLLDPIYQGSVDVVHWDDNWYKLWWKV